MRFCPCRRKHHESDRNSAVTGYQPALERRRALVTRNVIQGEQPDEAALIHEILIRDSHDRHPVERQLRLAMLLLSQRAQRGSTAKDRRVLILLHAIELADHPTSVKSRPQKINPVLPVWLHRTRQAHLKTRESKAEIDHSCTRHRLSGTLATRVRVVKRSDGLGYPSTASGHPQESRHQSRTAQAGPIPQRLVDHSKRPSEGLRSHTIKKRPLQRRNPYPLPSDGTLHLDDVPSC